MKTFVTGIAGAVIAGLLLFFAQHWWEINRTGQQQRISFSREAEITLSKKDLIALAEKANQYQNASVEVVTATNIGDSDIEDKSFSMPDGFIWGFGTVSNPNDNPKNSSISYDGKVMTVHYSLLPSGTKHSFWIASSSPSLKSEFSNDRTGVHVMTLSEKLSEEDPFPWLWVGLIGTLFLGLVLGAGLGLSTAEQELAKNGHNYKSLVQRPAAAVNSLVAQSDAETAQSPPL